MAIVTFWSDETKPNSQTASLIASAMQMGIDRNLKILILDATYDNQTLRFAFSDSSSATSSLQKKLNLGKIDISTGIEGLMSAVKSNKSSPEVVKSYTKPILNNKLDVLFGVKSSSLEDFYYKLEDYVEILVSASKYYDIIYLDLQKGNLDKVMPFLEKSDLIIYPMEQKQAQIDKFMSLWGVKEPFLDTKKVIPLLTKEDSFSKYNCDNVARRIGMRPGMPSIVYNTLYMEALQEARVVDLFIALNNDESSYRNSYLLRTIDDLNQLILERLETQKYNER